MQEATALKLAPPVIPIISGEAIGILIHFATLNHSFLVLCGIASVMRGKSEYSRSELIYTVICIYTSVRVVMV
ncbi:hypothetical protein ACV566_03600 [Staphylococcus aureus]